MSFAPGALMQRAADQTGLSDFGQDPFEDGLEVCCRALEDEAGLNAGGRAAAEAAMVLSLTERLRVEDWLRRHPEILAQDLPPQIFVVGLPRTGTTALSQLLSEDPAARSIRRWELNSLTPPADTAVADDPRIEATRAAFAARYKAMPALRTMLPIEAEDPSEHGQLLGLTFRNRHYPTLYSVPSYWRWLAGADMHIAYRYLAKLLRLMQWRTPGGHWNLKNPPDIFSLEAIKAVFPGCLFVWTHRDPAESIPSVCSLAALLRGSTVERVDRPALMQSILQFQSEGVRRGLQARARLGEASFVDISQKELGQDPIGVIRSLYARAGLPFTAQYEAHLARRIAERPRGQHGAHAYQGGEFGVSPAQIRAHFTAYLDRFGV
jgi:hypothetical protein